MVIDADTVRTLRASGLTLDSVPPADVEVG
jgi:hypothetical protein